jgi:hypothetical protein
VHVCACESVVVVVVVVVVGFQDASTTTGVFELALVGTDKDSESLLFPNVDSAVVSQSSHGRRVLKYSVPVVVAHFGGLTSCSKTKVLGCSFRCSWVRRRAHVHVRFFSLLPTSITSAQHRML